MPDFTWTNHLVRQWLLYFQLAMSLLLLSNCLFISGLADRYVLLFPFGFVAIIVSIVLLYRGVDVWNHSDSPWFFGRRVGQLLWVTAFHRPIDKYLLAVAVWNILLLLANVALVLSTIHFRL